MTHHPIITLTVLLAIEAVILTLASRPVGKRLFRFLPPMFWIYFLPMLANTAGLVPAESPLYGLIISYVLPSAIILLLLSCDIRAIVRLGPTALAVMAAGAAGIVLGAPAVVWLYRRWLPEDAWMGIGSLSASWIGGSANMIAVKEAIGAPDRVFLPCVIADTLIPYLWMGMLIALSAYQAGFDRWNGSNVRLLDELKNRTSGIISEKKPTTPLSVIVVILIAAAGTAIAALIGRTLPPIGNGVNSVAWSIILATVIGLSLSMTPLRPLGKCGGDTLGYWLLYLVLASIGAKTCLSHLEAAPIFLIAGATLILIHGAMILLAARLLKAPLALAAAASQAGIGGPASAPVVAGIYHPQLAPVGLLLAILGNILGTFLGLLASRLCSCVW